MFNSTRHPRSGITKIVSVASAALLAGLAFGSTAAAAPPKANTARQAQVQHATANAPQCTTPIVRQDWLLRLDPFVSYPWVPSPALDSELRYINDVDQQIDQSLALQPIRASVFPAQAVSPRVQLVDKPDRYVIRVTGQGVSPSDVKVEVQGQRVTVRYDKDETIKKTAAKGAQPAVEQFDSHFAESMQLASPVQAGRVNVTQVSDGVNVVLMKVHST